MKHTRATLSLFIALLLIVGVVAACSSGAVLTAPNNPLLHQLLANQYLLSRQTCIQGNNLSYYLEFNQSCMPNTRSGPDRPLDAVWFNMDSVAHRVWYALRGIA